MLTSAIYGNDNEMLSIEVGGSWLQVMVWCGEASRLIGIQLTFWQRICRPRLVLV